MSNHILITGTGRAGTTFLVQLLTLLGFDTGFTEKDFKTLIHPISLGGLEHDIRKPGSKPYIIKSPWICDYIDEIMFNKDITIDHIIIPIRNIEHAAESRRLVSQKNVVEGGLWGTGSQRKGEQEIVLMKKFYDLILRLSSERNPSLITFLDFPKLIKNYVYLWSKLDCIFYFTATNKTGYENLSNLVNFEKVFKSLANEDLIDVN
jgi:hypothetical protein